MNKFRIKKGTGNNTHQEDAEGLGRRNTLNACILENLKEIEKF